MQIFEKRECEKLLFSNCDRLTIERVQSHGGTVLESDTLDGLCQLMESTVFMVTVL